MPVLEEVLDVTMCHVQAVSELSENSGRKLHRESSDTAAQITTILDRVYKFLVAKPTKPRAVKLLAAGRDMAMFGFVSGPFRINL